MDAAPEDYEISTIPVDSLIMVHRLSADEKNDLKIGDVITFNQDGMVKVHRIIDLLPDGRIVTKGDANLNPDVPITSDDVIGKVVGVSPIVGKVVSFIKDFMADNPMLFIVAVILLIVMIFCIGEMISMLRKGPDEKG